MDEMLKNYQAEQKPMYEFFNDCIVPTDDNSHREENKLVYNTFKNWASENGVGYYSKISAQKFWREFEYVAKKNGYNCNSGRSNAFRYHTGIKVVGECKALLFGIRNNNEFNISVDDELNKL